MMLMLKGASRECINSELPAEITEKNTHHKICVEEYIVLPYQKYICNWAICLEYVYYHITTSFIFMLKHKATILFSD
jgi:hypothetical protein